MSIYRCTADLTLDGACRGHAGVDLYFCDECWSHACGHLVSVAAAGCPPTAFPPRREPPWRIVATTTWDRPTCVVLWHGAAWGGAAPVFVMEMRGRLSGASEWTRLIERGLN